MGPREVMEGQPWELGITLNVRQWLSAGSDYSSPPPQATFGNVWRKMGEPLLASSGKRAGMLNILQCRGTPPQQRTIQPQMSTVLRLTIADVRESRAGTYHATLTGKAAPAWQVCLEKSSHPLKQDHALHS